LDNCDTSANWSSASANTISYFTSDKKQGTGCVQMVGSATEEFKKIFSPSFYTGTTTANGVLSFWYYISDVTKTGTVRVELGSGGVADVNELSLDIRYEPFRNPIMWSNPRWFFSPYAGLGIGIFKFNPKTGYNGQEIELQPLTTKGLVNK